MSKKEYKRCLEALKIAKILFEEEGYHTRYLEDLERILNKEVEYALL